MTSYVTPPSPPHHHHLCVQRARAQPASWEISQSVGPLYSSPHVIRQEKWTIISSYARYVISGREYFHIENLAVIKPLFDINEKLKNYRSVQWSPEWDICHFDLTSLSSRYGLYLWRRNMKILRSELTIPFLFWHLNMIITWSDKMARP